MPALIIFGIVVVIVIGIASTAVQFWYITLPAILAFIMFRVYLKEKKAEDEKQKQIERNREIARQREAEMKAAAMMQEEERQKAIRESDRKKQIAQQKMGTDLVEICNGTKASLDAMPSLLVAANKFLENAKFEFQEGAFAPFWDAIENAANSLGKFHESTAQITSNLTRYQSLKSDYENRAPIFPVTTKSTEHLQVASKVATKMKKVVRVAQKEFQFATIFEQRKTNKLLIEGFTNLGQAIEYLDDTISNGIYQLSRQLDENTNRVVEVSERNYNALGDLNAEIQVSNAATAAHHKRLESQNDQAAKHLSELNVQFESLNQQEAARSLKEEKSAKALDKISKNVYAQATGKTHLFEEPDS